LSKTGIKSPSPGHRKRDTTAFIAAFFFHGINAGQKKRHINVHPAFAGSRCVSLLLPRARHAVFAPASKLKIEIAIEQNSHHDPSNRRRLSPTSVTQQVKDPDFYLSRLAIPTTISTFTNKIVKCNQSDSLVSWIRDLRLGAQKNFLLLLF
jgi:hypothetical protein